MNLLKKRKKPPRLAIRNSEKYSQREAKNKTVLKKTRYWQN